jgi:hypothetical protein
MKKVLFTIVALISINSLANVVDDFHKYLGDDVKNSPKYKEDKKIVKDVVEKYKQDFENVSDEEKIKGYALLEEWISSGFSGNHGKYDEGLKYGFAFLNKEIPNKDLAQVYDSQDKILANTYGKIYKYMPSLLWLRVDYKKLNDELKDMLPQALIDYNEIKNTDNSSRMADILVDDKNYDEYLARLKNYYDFFNKYPDFPQIRDLKSDYRSYVRFLLFGFDGEGAAYEMAMRCGDKDFVNAMEKFAEIDSKYTVAIQELTKEIEDSKYKLTQEKYSAWNEKYIDLILKD